MLPCRSALSGAARAARDRDHLPDVLTTLMRDVGLPILSVTQVTQPGDDAPAAPATTATTATPTTHTEGL